MTEPQALALVSTLGAMTLVGSALLVRRVPMALFLRLALVWLGIFLGAFLIMRLLPGLGRYFT